MDCLNVFSCKRERSYKVRMNIEQWGTTFGENLSTLPSVGILQVVGRFHENATNFLNTLALAFLFSLECVSIVRASETHTTFYLNHL